MTDKAKKSEDEIKKSIEELVNKAFENEKIEETSSESNKSVEVKLEENVEKAHNKSSAEYSQPGGKEADNPLHKEEVNGGPDRMKSDSPYTEKQSMMKKEED